MRITPRVSIDRSPPLPSPPLPSPPRLQPYDGSDLTTNGGEVLELITLPGSQAPGVSSNVAAEAAGYLVNGDEKGLQLKVCDCAHEEPEREADLREAAGQTLQIHWRACTDREGHGGGEVRAQHWGALSSDGTAAARRRRSGSMSSE